MGLNPKYLRYLFEKLPFALSEDDYGKLLPQNLTPTDLDLGQVVTGLIGGYKDRARQNRSRGPRQVVLGDLWQCDVIGVRPAESACR